MNKRSERNPPCFNYGEFNWGERSCQKPCRSKNCTIETCNVDCPDYIWDQETSPDSKPSVKIEDTKLAKRLSAIGLNLADVFPKVNDPLSGIDLETEYNLIQNRQSKLSSNLRHMVVVRFERLLHKE